MTNDQFCCKVERVAAKHGLEGVNSLFEQEHENRTTTREITEMFNRSVVRSAIEGVNQEVDPYFNIDGAYSAIVDEDLSSYEAGMRSRLRDKDIPVEELERDTVSDETVRRHIRNCLDLEGQSITLEGGRATIEWAITRQQSVIEMTIKNLQQAGEIEVGDYDLLFPPVKLYCDDCGKSYELDELLDQKKCDCSENPSIVDDSA